MNEWMLYHKEGLSHQLSYFWNLWILCPIAQGPLPGKVKSQVVEKELGKLNYKELLDYSVMFCYTFPFKKQML